VTRLPIRVRLTAVFVAVMGAVLLVIGLFLYYRTEHNLDTAINQALRARQGGLQAFTSSAARGPRIIPPGERFAQVLSVDGRVLDSRPPSTVPLLSAAEVRHASSATVAIERHERSRYLAGPARLQGRRVVVLAATALAERERALEGLGGALLIGLPLALLLAAGVAYAVAAGALSPVESIRRRAAGISRAGPAAGIPVPPADDEVRRLVLTLNDMLARLALAAEHERSFVANASHELRTPLAALNAELDLALCPGRTADELRSAVVNAKTDCDRLIRLAAGLLDLEGADALSTPARDQIDVDDLCREVAADFARAVEPGRTLTVVPSGLTVVGDEMAIGRAVRNMIENAFIHGAGSITVGSDLEPAQPHVRLWVCDEGRLDPELVEGEAFERFARGPGTAWRPGAGLGLALVRVVAESHGGSATLEPTASGVRATLTLPSP